MNGRGHEGQTHVRSLRVKCPDGSDSDNVGNAKDVQSVLEDEGVRSGKGEKIRRPQTHLLDVGKHDGDEQSAPAVADRPAHNSHCVALAARIDGPDLSLYERKGQQSVEKGGFGGGWLTGYTQGTVSPAQVEASSQQKPSDAARSVKERRCRTGCSEGSGVL